MLLVFFCMFTNKINNISNKQYLKSLLIAALEDLESFNSLNVYLQNDKNISVLDL